MSVPRIIEVPAGKLPPEMRKVMKDRRKLVEKMARQKLAEKEREKRLGPKARINPPKRGGYGERTQGVPTRLPRFENMPGRDV